MAINTYDGLKSAVQTWMTRDDIAAFVPDFITFATNLFNRRLRLRDMVETATLTQTNGVCALPDDYLEYIRVADASSRSLSFMPQDAAIQAYANNAAGTASHFTIVGSDLHIFPASGDAITLVYYAKIPALTATSGPNWVLEKHPEIYLRACQSYAADFIRDNVEAQKFMALTEALISEIKGEDDLSQYAKAGTWIRGVTP